MHSGGSCLRRLFTFRAGSKQFEQHGVSLMLEFLDRAVGGLFLHAVDDRLLHLRTEFGNRSEVFPPRGYGTGEMLHEVVNSTRSTGEMEEEIRTHYSPTQSRAPAHGSVRVGDVQYAL